jgi:hypothetical protein
MHDANVVISTGAPLIRPGSCPGVLYILRNPLDVAPSAANHWAESLDSTIERMNTPREAILRENRASDQVRQTLLDWSSHVLSWVDAKGLRVHVVRYEDLLEEPLAHFAAAARFLGLGFDDASLRAAIEASRFEELARQESSSGFRERPRRAQRFFRCGRAGAWREVLNADQVQRIVGMHGPTMRRFGYLDATGLPV